MLKKLRLKFILVNMSLVTLVLLIVFTAICVTSYNRLAMESEKALHRTLDYRDDMPPKFEFGIGHKKQDPPLMSAAIFSVELDSENNVVDVRSNNADVSDDVLSQAVAHVLSENRPSGLISQLQLRYVNLDTPQGRRIAFADTGEESKSMRSLVMTSLLIGAGGLVAFFLISLFLSYWVLKPVEKAWERQRQFVADASHELKTPLTVILANIGILRAHSNDTIGEQMKWVEYTSAEAARMKKLVDDLLFLARSDAAQTAPVLSSCNLSDIVWSCLLPFEPVAFEKGITLISDVASQVCVTGNESQLKQLLMILLDNACKYAGEHGKITVVLQIPQDGRACITVNNTGEAISPEALPHLFERFYRADEARAREKGGYGIGLSIAKTIVKLHRGKITAQSSESSGTTFTVTLPTASRTPFS